MAPVCNDLSYIVVVDGQILSAWKRILGKDSVAIKTNLFRQLTDAENQALALAARRYGEFLRLSVVVE